jgi:tRNA threonylcarbamoyladenosine biosynthesis protein TsaE
VGSVKKPVLLELAKKMPQEFVTHSSEETIAKGKEIARQLRAPVLVLLKGDLGAGKTTLTKGIISGLGAAREEEVTSPTFNLVHEFRAPVAATNSATPTGAGPFKVYHVDLYRVENLHDLESLGLEDALTEKAIVIIEWPEHFKFRTDWPIVEVSLDHAGGDSRRITISDLSLENGLT